MPDFDLVVVGSGPAGEKGAAQAAYFGKRVALVERRAVPGGAKIHACALPSKILRETALALTGFKQREPEVVHVALATGATMNELLCRREPLVSTEIERVRRNLERHGITVMQGHARFTDPHTMQVTRDDGSHEELRAPVFLVATGSSPYRPPGFPFDDPDVHDSDGILDAPRVPKTLVIIGGGVIGCELASMLAPLGVRVTLVERGDRLLPFADGEASRMLADSFTHLGIEVRFAARAGQVERAAGGIVTVLEDGDRLTSEQVLVCAGRTGNTADLGLAAAGIMPDERGRIPVNEHYQTQAPHIYAAGDVIGFPSLASTSMEQARIAMCHAFDLKYKTRLSPVLPLGIYTIPELSMVGATEEGARAKGLAFEVGRAYYKDNARGQIAGDRDGVLKLVFDRGDRRLLGAHIVGERATELIHVATSCMQLGATIDVFIDAVYNFPTLTELYKYAAYDGLGRLRQ